MFNRKPKIVRGWSVTRNPNKFDGDVALGLGVLKKDRILGVEVEELAVIRLDKDEARKLCDTIMGQFDE